jgi:hypothetical protein
MGKRDKVKRLSSTLVGLSEVYFIKTVNQLAILTINGLLDVRIFVSLFPVAIKFKSSIFTGSRTAWDEMVACKVTFVDALPVKFKRIVGL